MFKKKSRGPKVKSRPKRPSRFEYLITTLAIWSNTNLPSQAPRFNFELLFTWLFFFSLSQLTITRRSGFRKLSLHEAAQTFQGLTGSSPSNTVTQARIKLSSTGRAPPTQTGSATTIGTVHTSVSKEQSCSGWTGQIEVVSNPRIGEIACHVVGQNAPLSQHSLLPELQTTGSVHSDLLNSSNIHQNQQHISSTSNISISEIENTPIVALATSTALPYVQLEHQPDPIQEQNLSLPPFQVLSPKSNFPNLESSSSTSFKAHTSTSPNWVSRLKESGADCDKEYHHISTHAMTQEDNHPNFEKKSLCPSISHSSTKNVSPFLLPVSRPSENALVPQEPSLSTIPPTFATSHKCQNSDSAHFKPSFVGSDEASWPLPWTMQWKCKVRDEESLLRRTRQHNLLYKAF